jgi:predicted phosphodiesterase
MLVFGDLHLTHGAGLRASQDAARLVRDHQGHEILLNGDIFNLSHEPASRDPATSVAALFRGHAALREACAHHLRRGAPLTLLAGNHDQAVAGPEVRLAVLRTLELQDGSPLATVQWFARRAAVHVEHGHAYDPDNAPAHPLAPWSAETEPLGVALTRRFVVPSGASRFAHQHETTLLAGLLRALLTYGSRGPGVVGAYYRTAAQLWREAGGRSAVARARELGEARVHSTAQQTGLAVEVVRNLVRTAARPTLVSRTDTFFRLYLDRSLAALITGGGLFAAAVAHSAAALGVAGAGALYLSTSVARSRSRYAGALEGRLRAAARSVAEVSGAGLVIFGHSHRPDAVASHYLNPGSFALPSGPSRAYVHVDERGKAELRML